MRATSSVKDANFPYAEDTVAFILVPDDESSFATKDGRGFEHASTFDKKRDLLLGAQCNPGLTVLAVWPGETRSDVFEVDDIDAALEAFA